MIDIENLRHYYKTDSVFATRHSNERCRVRGIIQSDIREAVSNGVIIEQYPDDFPFPSCLIMGRNGKGEIIHIVMSDEGSSSRIITAYYPNLVDWETDYKTRRSNKNDVFNL